MKLHPIRPKPATNPNPVQGRDSAPSRASVQSRDSAPSRAPVQSRDRKGAGTTPRAPIATQRERRNLPPNPIPNDNPVHH